MRPAFKATLATLVVGLSGCAGVWGFADLKRSADTSGDSGMEASSDAVLVDDGLSADAPDSSAADAGARPGDATPADSGSPDGSSAVSARSCVDVRAAGATSDGQYVIDIDGPGPDPAFDVYCYHMGTVEPLEYLELPANLDAGLASSNIANYTDPRGIETDSFYKVRLTIPALNVDRTDRTFAFREGDAGPPTLPYAYAGSGVGLGDTSGHANIDLTGTPFRITASTTFVAVGYGPACVPTISADRKQVNLRGGGYGGACDIANPDGGNSFNTAGAGVNSLALEFGGP